ncbi:NF-kappa-B inhibitor zeta isoform X2 [Amia ocellicauda]|uniref:NF-kappa-B inhibitor zeta isoform X2 n=1 Tax=Amia ocellicauda TaxID=2972642 RepID=UPI0034645B6A
MIVDRLSEDSMGGMEQDPGLTPSPMNLGYFFGQSPEASEPCSSPGSQLSPRSPGSDCEASGGGGPCSHGSGESLMGGGRQQARCFQGVRVKNSVKELLMQKRNGLVPPGAAHDGTVQINSEGPEEFTAFAELKSILREGKRHAAPDCLLDTLCYKKPATFQNNLLTPPQTPSSNDNMESGPKEDPSLDANSNILDIFQMVRDGSGSPLSLMTVQVNWESPSQDQQRDLYHTVLPQESCGPVQLPFSSLPQTSNLAHNAPVQNVNLPQDPELPQYPSSEMCSISSHSQCYLPPLPQLQAPFYMPNQVASPEAQQTCDNPTRFSFLPFPPLKPQASSAQRPPLLPQAIQGSGGMSFFQWQIEQEERRLASLSQDRFVARDSDGDTFLHIAVAQGRRALSYVLARKMAAINMLDVKEHNGQSALQVSVAANQHLIVQDLLNLGAQINTADCWGRTPLHVCAEKGYSLTLKAIQRAVQANGKHLDLEAINFDGMTALHTAVLSHNAVVQELHRAQQPRSPHVQDLLQKRKLLGECVSTLLHMGASFKAKDRKSGHTVLHMAAEEANVELLRLFLDQPDSLSVVNDKTYNGNTALHIASALQNRMAQVDAVRLLMRKGGDPSAKNLENEQPAQLTPEGPVGEQVRRILKGKGALQRACPF